MLGNQDRMAYSSDLTELLTDLSALLQGGPQFDCVGGIALMLPMACRL